MPTNVPVFTPEIFVLLIILASMAYLFLSETLPIDVTAMLGLFVLILTGYLSPEDAFTGFASPTIITLVSMFFIGGALLKTGVAEAVAERVGGVVGTSEAMNVIAVMVMGATLSAFMSNVAATAVLLPAVSNLASVSSVSPSRLLIPLSFGTILGGMTTQIGTPPNILVADIMRESKQVDSVFQFIDFTPIGVASVVLGILFMVTAGRQLLPRRNTRRTVRRGSGDLSRVYRLFERQFSLRIPKGSFLDGKSLAEMQFGSVLGVHVIALVRKGKKRLYPRPEEQLQEDDILVVQGRMSRFSDLLTYQGVRVEPLRNDLLKELAPNLYGKTFEVQPGGLVGKSLRVVHFRERYGVVVIGIEREGQFIYNDIPSYILRSGDVLHVLGSEQILNALQEEGDLQLTSNDFAAEQLGKHLFLAAIPEGGGLDGKRIRDTKMGRLLGVWALGIIRDGDALLALEGRELLRGGDKVIVVGEPEKIERLSRLASIEVQSEEVRSELISDNIGMAEVVLAPRSRATDKTLVEIDFREKYDFQVLAVWREGRPYRSALSTIPLRLGDSLLIHGPLNKLHLLADDGDFVVLSQMVKTPRQNDQASFAVLGLLVMIGLSVARLQPVHISSFLGACLVVFTGAIKMEEAYRAVNWPVVFLVAALIPVGGAVEQSGAAAYLGYTVVNGVGDLGPVWVLVVLALLSSVLSQSLDGSVAVVLLAPVAINIADQMQLRPEPLLMGIALAASVAFMTPFSHKANLLVMGAGGYRVADYLKVGSLLSLIVLAVILVMIPLLFPFYG